MTFEDIWEYQQGALFLKEKHSSLEWKKSLAEFFYDEGCRKFHDEILKLQKENEELKTHCEMLREGSVKNCIEKKRAQE